MEPYLNKEGFLTYKGRPLVRNEDTIYYGNMSDDYVAMIRILEKSKANGMEVAAKLSVILMSTDPSADVTKSIINKAEKSNLYEALDIADIWLTRKAD